MWWQWLQRWGFPAASYWAAAFGPEAALGAAAAGNCDVHCGGNGCTNKDSGWRHRLYLRDIAVLQSKPSILPLLDNRWMSSWCSLARIVTLSNIVPEEDDDTSIGSYWFLPSIFLRGEGIPIGNSQPTETITWWLFSFSLIFRKFVMKLHANFTQTRNDLFAYLQYIAVMVWYYHCKGSGRNKNLPPRRFSTVGIVVEFRRAPTQLPPQTSSPWCAVCLPTALIR